MAVRVGSARRTVAVIACGALAADARAVQAGLPGVHVEVHSLSALLHNRPAAIAGEAERLAAKLAASGKQVVLAYADCGTYGALDELCAREGIERLAGLHCYDVVAGDGTVAALFAEEPGTYVLTDFLVAGFRRLVAVELGLDRRPELAADFFGHYRRAVWLTSRRTADLERQARDAAACLGLPLEIHEVDGGRSRRQLVELIAKAGAAKAGASKAGAAKAGAGSASA